jgi:hypothetical protein
MLTLAAAAFCLAGCQIVRVNSRDCIPEVWIDIAVITIESCKKTEEK